MDDKKKKSNEQSAAEDDRPVTTVARPGVKASAGKPPGLVAKAGTKPSAATAVKAKVTTKPVEAKEEAKEQEQDKPAGEAKKAGPVQAAPKELPPLGFEMEEIGADNEQPLWLNILIFGPFGVGKTYLIGTAQDDPDTNSVFLMDGESGKASIRFKKGIRRVPVKDFTTAENVIAFLDKYWRIRDAYLAAVKAKNKDEIERWHHNACILFRVPEEDRKDFVVPIYRTVAVDSLTEIQQYDMREIMQQVVKDDPERDPDVPSVREWGKTQTHIKELVRALRAMPFHKIFAALDVEKQDEKTKEVQVLPDLPGKLAKQMPGLVDIVGYYYSYVATEGEGENAQEVTHRVLLTQNSGKYQAKDRTDALGRFVMDPTIPMIFNKIREYNKAKLAGKS